jgi:hypothetical protein
MFTISGSVFISVDYRMVKVCEEQPGSPPPVNNSRQDPCYAPVTSHAASRMTLADVMKNGESGLDDSLGRKL